MNRRWLILALAAAIASPLGWASPAPARQRGQHPREQALRPGRPPGGQPPAMRPNNRALPPKWMQRLQQMPPDQQERFLVNNRRFQALPPDQQALVRNRLKLWNSLTPEQRAAMMKREEIWQRMSPDQRREVTEVILPEWRQLTPARRQALIQKLQQLQGLSDSDRKRQLKDPAFLQDLSPEDRNLLEEMSKLKVGPGGGEL
ncbi:MAG TPA: DUF3106 domain-containing protein [Candidatus Acidoferrales bacterium]|nr:DUF3106 domain-containing protein [Candidatus Acidoferrales bacterium]